jgi:hypothetical protein
LLAPAPGKNMLTDDSESTTHSSAGRRVQAGGFIAVFIGVLLLLFGPSPAPGIPLDPHKLDYLFIGIGLFLLVAGTVARWLLLD